MTSEIPVSSSFALDNPALINPQTDCLQDEKQGKTSSLWPLAGLGALILAGTAVLLATRPAAVWTAALCGAGLGLAAAWLLFRLVIRRTKELMQAGSPGQGEAPGFSSADCLAVGELVDLHRRRVIALLEIIRTVQAQTEDLLARYQTLTSKIAAAVVIRDADAKITFCNPYTEVLTGYALSEIYAAPGDFFLETVHPEDRQKYLRAFRISALGDNMQIRYRVFHKTGIEMWVETITEPIIQDGEVTSYISTTLDVSELVRRQKQVEEKNCELYDFTYMVSHDLKAPIFTIKGMLNILEEDLGIKLSAADRETLAHISKAAGTLERLVASVLEYFRISSQEDKLEEVNLKSILDDIANDYSQQINQSRVCLEVDPELPVIIGDRTKLYQIFSNLIGNAIKYRDPVRAPHIKIRLQTPAAGNTLVIAVSDNGLGIPNDKLNRIFRPFQRAHGNQVEGAGIGLACVKRLLDRIGGNIGVASQPGAGSTFTVVLKQSVQPARPEAPVQISCP